MTERTKTFEEAMEQLEQIVRTLEERDVPLEQSIDFYKKGMELSKYCQETLQRAEQQLLTVVGEDGTATEEDPS